MVQSSFGGLVWCGGRCGDGRRRARLFESVTSLVVTRPTANRLHAGPHLLVRGKQDISMRPQPMLENSVVS
jgi:hypothetical protein